MILLLQSIICFFLGAVFGNIGTTFFFRIPRGIPINGIEVPPMCSACRTRIKYPYYAPFFQFLLKGLKCNTCGAKIPFIYTVIEFFAGIFCVIFFLIHDLNSYFISIYLGLLVIFLSYLIFIQREAFFDKLNWMLLTSSLVKLHFEILPSQDIMSFLLTERVINGLIFAFLFCFITKVKVIQTICFFVCLSIFISKIPFIIAGAISLVMLIIFKTKKGIFLTPFVFLSLISYINLPIISFV